MPSRTSLPPAAHLLAAATTRRSARISLARSRAAKRGPERRRAATSILSLTCRRPLTAIWSNSAGEWHPIRRWQPPVSMLTAFRWSVSFTCQPVVTVNKTPFDFDGDHKTDISIFRPGEMLSGGTRRARQSSSGWDLWRYGRHPDAGRFYRRRKDRHCFLPSRRSSQYFILRSEDNTFLAFPWGTNGDIPTPADFDGDGKTDAAVFRPSAGTWFILPSGGGAAIISQFGTNGDQPVAADYDNDGKADIGIVRTNGANKEWWIQRSSAGLIATVFGQPTDKATPGDYTGDGKADIAFFGHRRVDGSS